MRNKSGAASYPRVAFRVVGLLWLVGSFSLHIGRAQSCPQIQSTDAALQQGSSNPLLIGSGDLLDVRVFQTPDFSAKYRVTPNGTVILPQAKPVVVAGSSALDAGAKIETALREQGIMLDPHVVVFVEEYASQAVIVLGEVVKPGTYAQIGEHSLYGALSAAGGATINQGGSITITHQSDPTRYCTVPITSPDYAQVERQTRIYPGDTVFVSRADVVYIVGDVAHPGPYNMPNGQPLSVLELLSIAQGLNKTAAASKASIVRDSEGIVKTIPIDLRTLTDASLVSQRLMPHDILVVPRSGLKSFLDVVIPSATTAVVSAVVAALVVR